MLFPQDRSSKIGYIGLGGCGLRGALDIMRLFDPVTTPYLSTLVANLEHLTIKTNFQETRDPLVKRWQGSQSSFVFLANPGRKSEGAGANPEMGREAAGTPEAKREFEKFISDKDQIVIEAGLGGGTGGGAIPVVAKYCLDMGKTVIAIAVMPRPNEGRTLRAQKARTELLKIVPTITIFNSYISTYLKEEVEQKERQSYDMDKSFRLVSEYSINPTFFILQEIMHRVGETVHSDHADLRKILASGNEIYASVAPITDQEAEDENFSAKQVFDRLSAGHFQNKDILKYAEIAGLWYRNWSPYLLVDELTGLAREHWGTYRSNNTDDFELLEGYRLKNEEGDLNMSKWVAVIAAAKMVKPVPQPQVAIPIIATLPEIPSADDFGLKDLLKNDQKAELPSVAFNGLAPEAESRQATPTSWKDRPSSGRSIPLEFVMNGKPNSCKLPIELADQYPDLENLSSEGRQEIFEAIREVTKGYPDSLVKWDRTIRLAEKVRSSFSRR